MGVPTMNFHLADWHADPAGGGALGDAARFDHLVTSADDVADGLSRYLAGRPVDESIAAGRARVLRTWLHEIDGQATARQAQAIADLVSNGRMTPRRNPLALRRSLPGAAKRLALMSLNTGMGRPFDMPFSAPARAGGIEVSELGYADRLVRQLDVDRWCARLRQFRASARVVPVTAEPVGAARDHW
jgi:hypothetical protein